MLKIKKKSSGYSGLPFKKTNPEVIRESIDSIGRSDRPHYIKREFPVYKYKDSPNDNFLRILPAHTEDHDFNLKISVHSYIGLDEGSYLCLRMFDERCPICEKSKEAYGDGNSVLGKKISPTNRYLFRVIDTSKTPQRDGNVLVLDAPRTLGEEILIKGEHPKTKEPLDISDIEEGKELYFRREIESVPVKTASGSEVIRKMPKYKSVQLGDDYPLEEDLLKKLAPQVFPFADLLNIPSFSELNEVAKYVVGSKELPEDDEEEVAPVGKKKFVIKLKKK